MNGIRYRVARCQLLNNEPNVIKKVVCLSVEHINCSEQISHCIELVNDQVINKTDDECVDLAFRLMSGSIAKSANKLINSINVVGTSYIPNL